MTDQPTNPSNPSDPNAGSNPPSREQRVNEIIAAYLQAAEGGQPPDQDRLLSQHPDLAAELREFFADKDRFERLAQTIGYDSGSAAAATAAPAKPRIRYFGDYELLDEIARGGMGVVYKARQVSLNRPVAVKMILSGQFASPADVRRFHAEAEHAANLDHPNIVPIYEVGEHAGQHYFSMKLIEGGSLVQRLGKGPMDGREAAGLMATVARAVHYGHQRGILHRDLKPANVLLDAGGTPYVTDFGLAKRVEAADETGADGGDAIGGDMGLTQPGAVLGTPLYMAPEQAAGRPKDLSTASDVYSLGAVFYHLLAGRPPFAGNSTAELFKQLLDAEPRRPSAVRAGIDRDLETVCLKCLQKDPAKRYGSAEALADDLARWLRGEPIAARPVSRTERAVKWAKRHPAPAALAAVSAAAVVVFVVGLLVTNYRVRQQRNLADHARMAAEVARRQTDDALGRERQALVDRTAALAREQQAAADRETALQGERRVSYYNRIALAQAEFAANNLPRAGQLLNECPLDLRGWEWNYLLKAMHAERATFTGHGGAVACPVFSPDGSRLATLSTDGTIRLWSVPGGKELLVFRKHTQQPGSFAFSPDGRRVVSGSSQAITFNNDKHRGEVLVWEAATGKVLATFGQDIGGAGGVTFTPDGNSVAAAGGDKILRVWDAATGQEARRKADAGEFVSLRFTRDGRRLLAAGKDSVLFDFATFDRVLELTGQEKAVLSPDEALVATVADGDVVCLREAATGQLQATLRGHGHTTIGRQATSAMVLAVAFSPDGQRLASAGSDRTVKVWDVEGRRELYTLRAHDTWVTGVAWSPDGRWLATTAGSPLEEFFGAFIGQSSDPPFGVRLWDAAARQEYRQAAGRAESFAAAAAAQVGVAVAEKAATLIDLSGSAPLRPLGPFSTEVRSARPSADGKRVAVVLADESGSVFDADTVRVIDVADGRTVTDLKKLPARVGDVAFSPDGGRLAVAMAKEGVQVVEVPTGKVLRTLPLGEGGSFVAFSPDGARLAAGHSGVVHLGNVEPTWNDAGHVTVWDLASGVKVLELPPFDKQCKAAAFAPDGRTLAVVTPADVRLYDVATGAERPALSIQPGATPVTADGTMTGAATIDVRERTGDSARVTLPGQAASAAFTPDGRRLVTATVDGLIVWDLTTGGQALKVQGGFNTAAFAADGQLLAAVTGDGVRVYDASPIPIDTRSLVAAIQSGVDGLTRPRGPATRPAADPRPQAVRDAIARGTELLDKSDPAAALVWFTEALKADPDPARQRTHRVRIALLLQAAPRLRPLKPAGAVDVTAFVADKAVDRPATPDVTNPLSDDHICVELTADGRHVALWNRTYSGQSRDRKPLWPLRVFDTATGQPLGPALDVAESFPNEMGGLSADGRRFAKVRFVKDKRPTTGPAGDGDADDDEKKPQRRAITVWDVATGQVVQTITPDWTTPHDWAWPGFAVTFSPDGRWLSFRERTKEGWKTGTWDVQTAKPLDLPAAFNRAVFSSDGSRLLATWDNESINRINATSQVYDAQTLQPIGPPLEVGDVAAAEFSPDGGRVVVGNGYYVGVWDVKTGKRAHAAVVAKGGARAVDFSPDGRRFVAASDDGARVHDARTGDALTAAMPAGDRCHVVRFTADGAAVLTVTEKEARLWDAATGDPLTANVTAEGDWDFTKHFAATASADGPAVLTRGSDKTAHFLRWPLAPDDRPAADLADLARLLAGRKPDAAGGALVPLTPAESLALGRRLAAAFPDRFGPAVATADEVLVKPTDPRVPAVLRILAETKGDAKPDVERREAACGRLGNLGSAARPALPDLIARLGSDASGDVRSSAAQALGRIAGDSPLAVPALVAALEKDKDGSVRAGAAVALGDKGAARHAAAALARALANDAADGVRMQAAKALRWTAADDPARGDVLAALRGGLKDKNWRGAVEAAGTLGRLEPAAAPDAVPVLVATLADKKRYHDRAMTHVARIGPPAKAAVPYLIAEAKAHKTQSHFIEDSWRAVAALGCIGPGAADAVPALIDKLPQDDLNPHWHVSGGNGVGAYPPDDNPVCTALGRIGGPAVPPLLKAFKESKDAKTRLGAVMALGQAGPAAKDALPELEAARDALKSKLKKPGDKDRDEEWLADALAQSIKLIRTPNFRLPAAELYDD